MMATAVNINKADLLDLSFLTPEEKAKIEAVIKADQCFDMSVYENWEDNSKLR